MFLDDLERLEAEVTRQGLGYGRRRASPKGSGDITQQNFVDQIKLANREASTMYELAKDFSSSLTLDETLKL